MAYYSKYTGAELEEKLDKVEEIPQLIAQMITGKDFVTKEDLLCVLKDYAPSDYRTIPIDNNTIYWENGVLKAATSEEGQCQWELREHNGIQYLYSKLPVVTQYDVTMYADVNHLDLPSIYDGLPIDGDTIYWEETEDGKVLKAKSIGGSGESVDAGWIISVISNAGFATQNWVNNQNFINQSYLANELLKYVTIDNYQEIIGVKNFLNGIQIADLPITKLEGYEDVIYIDANVVVRGGLTMYSTGEADIPSLTDSIVTDGITILNDNGVLKINPDIQLGGITEEEYNAIVNLINTKWTTDNTKISHWDTAYGWGNHANAGYVAKQYVDNTFVTFEKDEIITGLKTFTKGIQIGIGDSKIKINQLQDDILYIDSNVVIRGGLTMYYEDGEINLPSIKEEIGNAGYDGVTGLASFNSSQFYISSDGTVTIIGGSAGLDTAQLKDYLDSNKYTTETWVKAQGYASASSLSSLQTKVNNFLEGSDTDTIINKWKELEVFLSGLSESDNLATILSTKWTTDNNLINQWNTAYGWGDHSKVGYALKSYVDSNFVTLGTKQTITGEKNFKGGLRVNDSPSIYYDATNKYWKLEGDLLVTGGVTMYGTDEGDLSSILDSLPIASTSRAGIASFDSTYFSVNASGKVTLTSAPSMVSILGALQDVRYDVSGTTNEDVFLFKQGGTSEWTTKKLSDIGGGGTIQRPLRWIGYDSGMWDGSSDGLIVIPTSLKNPNALTFTGAVSATYDGSSAVTVNIPVGGGDVDLSNYLPLTGGTITHSNDVGLWLQRTSGSGSLISFKNLSNYGGLFGVIQDSQFSGLSAMISCQGRRLSVLSTGGVYYQENYGTTPYEILHSGNYSSYALPLSGGTLNGKLTIKTSSFNGQLSIHRASTTGNSVMEFRNDSGTMGTFGVFGSAGTYPGEFYLQFPNAEERRILHTGNYSDYALPLSGGTITGYLNIHYNHNIAISSLTATNSSDLAWNIAGKTSLRLRSSNNAMVISVSGTQNNRVGLIQVGHQDKAYASSLGTLYLNKFGGDVYIGENLAIHAGNYSSYALPLSGGTLKGDVFMKGYSMVFGGSTTATHNLYLHSGVTGELNIYNSNTNKSYTILHSGNISSYNAGSATKLQTARTIWGQSFDGTGNINGTLYLNNNVSISGYVNNVAYDIFRINENNHLLVGYGHAPDGNTSIYGNNVYLRNGADRGYALTALANGNVGIGTTSPIHKLHVVGTTYMDGSAVISGSLLPTTPVELGNGNYPWSCVFSKQVYVLGEENNEIFTQYYANGDLGSSLMSIRNRLNFRWYDTYWGIGTIRGDNKYSIGFGFVYNNSLKLRITTEGNLLVTGGITMYSDIRKKTKLQDVELSLSQIANAPLIQHYYNSDQDKTTHVGSIAQYWAGLNDWFCKLDNEGFYTMEIQNCALASAISIARHLEKYESKTDKKIRMLKKRVQELEDKLEKLEGGNYVS